MCQKNSFFHWFEEFMFCWNFYLFSLTLSRYIKFCLRTQHFWAAEYILAAGNPNVILCEQGIRTFDQRYARNTLALVAIPVLQSGFSAFLVKMVVSASGSHRLSGFSHRKFYFYYPLKLRRVGALAILTSSLPPVCYLLHKFLGSLGI
jgi:3-deoxy-D-arabino-heptulosonate 7-phosphate (DAHP) synthase